MPYTGIKLHQAESKAYADGGNVSVSLQDLPDDREVKHILLRLELAIVSGGGATVAGEKLHQFLSNIIIGKHHRSTGSVLRYLNWAMRGKEFSFPGGLAAAAATFRRNIDVMIPYSDQAAGSPDDTARHTALFKDEPIEVKFGTAASIQADMTSATGTLRTGVFHQPAKPGVVKTESEINYTDWSQSTIYLTPGYYSHVIVCRETGGVITDLQIASVLAYADGEVFLNNIPSAMLIDEYDWYRAEGAAFRTSSTTAPVAGEEVTEAPALAGGSAATVSAEFLPIAVPPDKYDISKLINAQNGVRLDLTGTDTSFRVAHRKVVERTPAGVAQVAAKQRIANAERKPVRVKTRSAKPLSLGGPLSRTLPLKIG